MTKQIIFTTKSIAEIGGSNPLLVGFFEKVMLRTENLEK